MSQTTKEGDTEEDATYFTPSDVKGDDLLCENSTLYCSKRKVLVMRKETQGRSPEISPLLM